MVCGTFLIDMKCADLCFLGVLFCSGMALQAAEFEKPRALLADGVRIQTEAPGYASPSLADIDGDGVKELLVGQFGEGKVQVFKKKGDSYAKGSWLKAGGKTAKVPGVW